MFKNLFLHIKCNFVDEERRGRRINFLLRPP